MRAFSITLVALAIAAPAAAQSNGALDAALARAEALETQRERNEAEVEGLETQRRTARRRLRERVRAFYRMRRAGSLPLSGGFDSLIRHHSRVERLERLVARDAASLRRVSRRVDALRAESEHLEDELAASRRSLESLRRQEQSRSQELELLSQMIEDPAAWSGPSMQDPGGLRLSEPSGAAYRLTADRGRLPLPVGGSAQIADAEREGGQGLAITASAGVTVRAVAPGTVAYAAPHPAYGNLVIVDHRDGHYTVYGGVGRIGVRPGAEVGRDMPVGLVGAHPIFFQVRRGTRPLPAREWLGI